MRFYNGLVTAVTAVPDVGVRVFTVFSRGAVFSWWGRVCYAHARYLQRKGVKAMARGFTKGSNVLVTLGSTKTGNLRTVPGVFVGYVTQDIPGTRCAYLLCQVATASGLVTGHRVVKAV